MSLKLTDASKCICEIAFLIAPAFSVESSVKCEISSKVYHSFMSFLEVIQQLIRQLIWGIAKLLNDVACIPLDSIGCLSISDQLVWNYVSYLDLV